MAFLLALSIWVVTAVSVWLLIDAKGAMPVAISELARSIDAQFMITLVITGVVFVLAQGLLGWFILKYRDRAGARARFVEGNNLIEIGGAVVIGVVFVGLAVAAQNVWARLHLNEGPANQVVVEITGEQFAWNVRYPGADGRFGRTSPELYDPMNNPMGLVPDDPAGQDDIVVLNTLAVPVNRPVELQLGSKDVLHGFFMPALRIKQDTVPGMRIPLRFTAEQTGTYEVACAELCGLGHYRMRGFLQVMEESEFQSWLAEQAAEQ
jgi:cytochrome c oxidase subunit 2